jgi:hypothetical protein
MTVISITGDSDVECVLDYFHKIRLPWITWNFISMSADLVYQRPIGRNIAAKASKADVIWFTDCDYVFGNDSLDALCQFPDDNGIYCPEIVWRRDKQHRTQKVLSNVINAIIKDNRIIPQVIDIDRSYFVKAPMEKAVGGVQIVSGNTARKIGYLPEYPEWQKPLKEYNRDDGSAFWRQRFKKLGKLNIPNIYRF